MHVLRRKFCINVAWSTSLKALHMPTNKSLTIGGLILVSKRQVWIAPVLLFYCAEVKMNFFHPKSVLLFPNKKF